MARATGTHRAQLFLTPFAVGYQLRKPVPHLCPADAQQDQQHGRHQEGGDPDGGQSEQGEGDYRDRRREQIGKEHPRRLDQGDFCGCSPAGVGIEAAFSSASRAAAWLLVDSTSRKVPVIIDTAAATAPVARPVAPCASPGRRRRRRRPGRRSRRGPCSMPNTMEPTEAVRSDGPDRTLSRADSPVSPPQLWFPRPPRPAPFLRPGLCLTPGTV